MKHYLKIFVIALLIHSAAVAQDKLLLETAHFNFHSNALLNLHLFLYKHASAVKSLKVPDDSLKFYLDRVAIPDKVGSHAQFIAAIKYYRDSMITKDLTFDSTRRKFSVMLATGTQAAATGWQKEALESINSVRPFFITQLWPSIDSANKAWIRQVKPDLSLHEAYIVNRLQKIFGMDLPKQKIRIDLADYGSWAGAYSYSQGIDHIIIATNGRLNVGRYGVEIVFHEASHFLSDKMYDLLTQYFKEKNAYNTRRQTWHNLIFYTTGQILKEVYDRQGSNFNPYYKEAKFEERVPFKLSTDAFALYWNPYIRGETTMEAALKNIVEYIVSHEQ